MIVSRESSYIRFVLPFLFPAERFVDSVAAVDRATWPLRGQDRAVWERWRVPADDLLPHVANYLNLGTDHQADPFDDLGMGCLWSLGATCRESLDGLAAGVEWTLTTQSGAAIPVELEHAGLALFSLGVGFLTFRIKVRSERLDDWLEVQHFARFARGKRAPTLRCRRAVADGFTDPFVPSAVRAAMPEPRAGDGFTLGDVAAPLVASAGLAYRVRDVFVRDRLLPYAVLFVDAPAAPGEPDRPLDLAVLRQTLFRIRRMFHPRQKVLPARGDLRLSSRHYLEYAHRQWFWFTLEGGGFLAADAPRTPFFRAELPGHLDEQYFLIYLLTLLQRFALIGLSDDVARQWNRDGRSPSRSRHEIFARIRESLFSFTARGYFAQVMQRENHHRCYRRWQRVFQVARLYDEVRTEVEEMSDYLREADSRLREARLALYTLLLTVLIGAPSLAIGFLSINLRGVTAAGEGLSTLAAAGLVGTSALVLGLLFTALWWLVRRGVR